MNENDMNKRHVFATTGLTDGLVTSVTDATLAQPNMSQAYCVSSVGISTDIPFIEVQDSNFCSKGACACPKNDSMMARQVMN